MVLTFSILYKSRLEAEQTLDTGSNPDMAMVALCPHPLQALPGLFCPHILLASPLSPHQAPLPQPAACVLQDSHQPALSSAVPRAQFITIILPVPPNSAHLTHSGPGWESACCQRLLPSGTSFCHLLPTVLVFCSCMLPTSSKPLYSFLRSGCSVLLADSHSQTSLSPALMPTMALQHRG